MAYYDYPLPDGNFIQVPLGTPISAAEEWARSKFPESFKSAEPPKPQESGFIANLKGGARELAANYGLGIGALGNEEAARKADREARAQNENVKTTSWEDVKAAPGIGNTISTFGAFARDQAAQTLPYMAATAGGAQLGAMAGAPLGPVGSLVGAGVGGVAANFPAMFGSNLSRQDQENPNLPFNKTAAAEAGVAQSALDATSTLFIFGKMLGLNKIAGKALPSLFNKPAEQVEAALVKEAQASLLKATGKGAVAGAAVEMPTEIAQQVLERWQAGLPLTGTDANKEYEAAAAAAGVVGGIGGGAGGVHSRAQAGAEVRAKDRAAAQEAAAAAASQEQQIKEAEAAKKLQPEYLLGLEKQYTDGLSQIDALQKQRAAIGKVSPDSAEAVEAKDLQNQIKEAKAAFAPLRDEYAAAKPKIAAAKEQARVAAMSPLDYQMEQAGVDVSAPAEPSGAFTGEMVEPPKPLSPAQQYAQQQMTLAQQQDQGTYEEKDFADYLMKDPAQAAAVVADKVPLPGLSKKQSDTVLTAVKMQLKEQAKQEKQALDAEMAQRSADMKAATQPTEATDPLAMLKESMAQDEENRQAGRENLDHLNHLFVQGLGEDRGPARVKVSEDIRPTATASNAIRTVDDLYATRDLADKEATNAFASGNREAGMAAVTRREAAATALNNMRDSSPVGGGLIAERKKQEGALADAAFLIDDLKNNNVLGARVGINPERVNTILEGLGPNGTQAEALRIATEEANQAQKDKRGTASSTPETLKNQIEKARQDYTTAVINEAAITRAAFGKSLKQDEALKAGLEIRRVFDEWVTRAAALPRKAVEEKRVVQPAQMRGTEIVKGAVEETVDPRPLEERRLGAYKEATEVLQEQIKRIGAQLASVPNEGVRVPSDMKMQFAATEAAKVAEARGETADTRGGELRRRREFVVDQIDKALQTRRAPFRVQEALQKARDLAEVGKGSTDVVSGIEGQRFTPGLLDAAEELAGRVVTGVARRTRTSELKLIQEINDAARAEAMRPGEGEVAGTREGQLDLFDPKAAQAKQEETNQRINQLTSQLNELRSGKFTSLKEGVSAAKRISGLEKAVAILTADKKQGIDADVAALRKESERMKGDVGFVRANAANFAKAPAVVKGRAAVETTNQIKAEWARIEKESDKAKRDIETQLAEIDNKLAGFDWLNIAKRGTGKVNIGTVRGKELVAAQKDFATLARTNPEEFAALQRKKGTKVPTVVARGPKVGLEAAETKINDQLRAVKMAYQEAITRSLANLKAQALTPELKTRKENAQAAIEGAFVWLRELSNKLDAAKKKLTDQRRVDEQRIAFEKQGENAKFIDRRLTKRLLEKSATAKPEFDELEQRITLEQERLNNAAEELHKIDVAIRDSYDGAKIVAGAATDKGLVFENHNLDYLVNRLREQGYVVDAEKGTVKTERGVPAVTQQKELERQKEAVTKAKAEVAQVADSTQEKLAAIQTGLGLPGTRRVAGRMQEVKSAAELAKERAAQERENRAMEAEEASGKKAQLEAAIEIDTEKLVALEKKAKANNSDMLQSRIKTLRAELRKRQRALEILTGEGTRKRYAATTAQSSAPASLRAGTAESGAAIKAQTERMLSSTRAERLAVVEARRNQKLANALAKALPKTSEKEVKIKPKSEGNDTFEADTDLGEFGGMQDMLFRVGQQDAAKLAPAQAKEVMDGFLETAPESLKKLIKFYASAKDIPAKMMQALHRAGAVDENGRIAKGGALENGDILIVGDAHANVVDLLETISHEVTGHYGVSKLLGQEGVNKLAATLVDQGNIDALAKQLGVEEAIVEANATSDALDENDALRNKRKVQEILGYLAQKVPSQTALEKAKGFVRALMGAINAALQKMGLRSPFKVTANDLHYILARAKAVALQEGGAATGEQTLLRAAAKHENAALADASNVFIGRGKPTLQIVREEALGLKPRVRFIDNLAAIKEAVKRGDPTVAIQVMYDLMNYAQRNHFVNQAVMYGAPVRSKWEKVNGKDVYKTEAKEGASLKGVADKLAAVKGYGNSQAASEAFTMLALAKRAQTRHWDRVFGDVSGDTAENAKRAKARAAADVLAKELDAGTSPFAAAWKEYQDFNKGMLQFAQQAGVISEADFRALAGERNYTPLFRADKHNNLVLELDAGRTLTVGRLADEPHLQRLLGGSGQVMDFFTASVRNASVLIETSLHNTASREAIMALEAIGAAHPLNKNEKSANDIEFRKNGDLQRFAIDTDALGIPTDLVVKGFAGVPATLPGWLRLMGIPATFLRKAVTRNPLYMMRTLVRDPLSAWLTTGASFNPITDTFKELEKSLAGTADKTLERRGLVGGMLFSDDITDIERIQKEVEANPWSFGYVWAKLDAASHEADAITRRNVYNGAIKEGASEIEATLAAYESMPFSKRGSSPSVRFLSHTVPFLSAMIQGWDVMYRAAKGDMPLHERVNVRMKLVQRGAMIAGMSMLYAMAMQDDDQYNNANTSERLSNWFVKLPGLDATVKLPVPFELGVIFKMLPEALVRATREDKNLASELRDVGGALANMAPNLVAPQAMLPLIEGLLNRSFYTGNAIEGRGMEGLDIGMRYDSKTSELSKALGFDINAFGTQIGISPKMLEYMASQYTGGLYPAMAAVVDNLLPAPSTEKPDRTLAEMPLFRSALVQENAGGEVNRLYDKIEKFTRYVTTMKKLQAESPEDAQRYIADNQENIAKGAAAEKIKAALNKVSEAENKVRVSAMSGEQKKFALDNFKKVKTNLAHQYATFFQ